MKHGRNSARGFRAHRGPRGPIENEFGMDGFGPRGPGGRGGGRGGMGRRAKRFTGDELRLLVLALINEHGPRHGYDLIRLFAEQTNDAYRPSPGVLYPLLTMLADMGLVRETDDGDSRRSFVITDAGKAQLAEDKATLDTARERLAAMASIGERVDRGPVKRAMMNLRTATLQRLTAEGADDALALSIAEELDRAAHAIERIGR